jgi:hypothetical protein
MVSVSSKQSAVLHDKVGGPTKLSTKSPARTWKPVTEAEIYVVLGLNMHMGIIQKPTLVSYFR